MIESKLSGLSGFAVLIQVSPKKRKKGSYNFHLFIDSFGFYLFICFFVFCVLIMEQSCKSS